jgi:hypothetical protein
MQGLGWKNAYGTGKGGDTITSGLEGAWTQTPIEWSHLYLREPLRLRVGAGEEPRRRLAVDAQGRAAQGTVPDAHDPEEGARADDAHDRPLAADGPRVRQDLQAFPGEPRGVQRCLRARLVQADAPRHGPALAPARGRGAAGPALAGPGASRRSRARRPTPTPSQLKKRRSSTPGSPSRSSCARRGPPPPPTAAPTARRRQRRARPPRAAEGLGGEPIPRSSPQVLSALDKVRADFNDAQPGGRQEGLARRSDRPRRGGGHRGGGEGGRARRSRFRSPRAAPTPPRR